MRSWIRKNCVFCCLPLGWIFGIFVFAIFQNEIIALLKVDIKCLTKDDFLNAITNQVKIFTIVIFSGFSSLAMLLSNLAVLLKSFACTVFSCLMVCSAHDPENFLKYLTVTLCSAFICVLLTSAGRNAVIYHKNVPKDSFGNLCDYLLRQLYTVGLSVIVLLVCLLTVLSL